MFYHGQTVSHFWKIKLTNPQTVLRNVFFPSFWSFSVHEPHWHLMTLAFCFSEAAHPSPPIIFCTYSLCFALFPQNDLHACNGKCSEFFLKGQVGFSRAAQWWDNRYWTGSHTGWVPFGYGHHSVFIICPLSSTKFPLLRNPMSPSFTPCFFKTSFLRKTSSKELVSH